MISNLFQDEDLYDVEEDDEDDDEAADTQAYEEALVAAAENFEGTLDYFWSQNK